MWRQMIRHHTHLAGLVQKVQDSQSVLYEVNAGLVVAVVDERPLNLLLHVLCLLQLKHMLWGEEERGRGLWNGSPGVN